MTIWTQIKLKNVLLFLKSKKMTIASIAVTSQGGERSKTQVYLSDIWAFIFTRNKKKSVIFLQFPHKAEFRLDI